MSNSSSTPSSPFSSILTRPPPFGNSYWVSDYVIACEYPWNPKEKGLQKLDLLLAAGVRTFIDLTEHEELESYDPHLPNHVRAAGLNEEDVVYYQFSITDRSIPDQPTDYMRCVLDVLRNNAEQGRICAVHCRGGIGRTGMVVGCWLVHAGIAKDGEHALRIIESKWRTVDKYHRYPHSPETGPQCELVRSFSNLSRWYQRLENRE